MENKLDSAEELYKKLISPIEDKMISIVSRIVRDQEESTDVFQEVLAVIWRKLARIERHPNPHAYILRICISRSYDALRKRSRRREVQLELDKIKTIPAKMEKHLEVDEIVDGVREAILLLPVKQGQAILLRVVEDMPYNAIGDILGCSEVTARSHFSKGKTRIRKILSGTGVLGHNQENYDER